MQAGNRSSEMADESQAEEPQLKVHRDGNVVVLTMNNPQCKNALKVGRLNIAGLQL